MRSFITIIIREQQGGVKKGLNILPQTTLIYHEFMVWLNDMTHQSYGNSLLCKNSCKHENWNAGQNFFSVILHTIKTILCHLKYFSNWFYRQKLNIIQKLHNLTSLGEGIRQISTLIFQTFADLANLSTLLLTKGRRIKILLKTPQIKLYFDRFFLSYLIY